MERKIIAAVITEENMIRGGVPVFFAEDQKQQLELAKDLGRVLRADVHRLINGVYVLMTSDT